LRPTPAAFGPGHPARSAKEVTMTQQKPDQPAKPSGGTGGHGPAPTPASKGSLYDGNFPPGVKPSDVQDPGDKTTTGNPERDKTDNRS
jgi:hypothetical protein